MQSNHLILGSSLLALVLCAVPYGCAGKSIETPSDSSVGGKNTSCCSDGTVANHPDGTVENHSDGYRNGDGRPDYGDGNGDGSALPIFSDGDPGPIPTDGDGVSSDGWDGDSHGDGSGDGWDGSADGQADGFSG
jgi:hypothetical protein